VLLEGKVVRIERGEQNLVCRLLICDTNGLLFNPYGGRSDGDIGSLVESVGAMAGVCVKPRQARCGMVTNIISEDIVAGEQTQMRWLHHLGGWSPLGQTPTLTYMSDMLMGSATSHMVRASEVCVMCCLGSKRKLILLMCAGCRSHARRCRSGSRSR
jgi:hypothetical protein